MQPEIGPILDIAVKAGAAVMWVYNDNPEPDVTFKEDESPLTLADKISHEIIVLGLTELYPGVPILSEEGAAIDFEIRKEWEYYWCVDPLDGTKEFINRNGEFTVNIALIHKNVPVLGVIFVPCMNTLYFGSGKGSFKQRLGENPVPIKSDSDSREWVSVGSRSHSVANESDFLQQYPIVRHESAGSSIKFCLIAEGKAHIYYRKGPTMEWDTAAGHAIAGFSGAIVETDQFQPFLYNKENLRNGGFVCRVNN
ncbi:3'(2'),5'-bisphosphate nucleotidase CysQ [Flavihumibacter stibioxidans]|uniref:3'(2'),5'-bisphosphate nucleotidase CysQ n=1 Tax=Flavihumibacter stibioxidans TaxID=1834163 RepID=A0ABR7M5L7_9BACT|nr:3'(2'),5'-bisphosphate nucleotidase CysQ [Flavihumibacter stibioxidans]MBC6490282.1 3'(2'),5'-bisphosphate nucleotidase [Flavihumibacter stibioxidans]